MSGVSREEAVALVNSGLPTKVLWIWCAGLVLVPTLVLSAILAIMS
jgi:hypothetical protein